MEIIEIQKWIAEEEFIILDWNYNHNELSLTTHFMINNKDVVFMNFEEDLDTGFKFTLENFILKFKYIKSCKGA